MVRKLRGAKRKLEVSTDSAFDFDLNARKASQAGGDQTGKAGKAGSGASESK